MNIRKLRRMAELETAEDNVSETKTVGASQTLAELLGVALDDDVIAVDVQVDEAADNPVYYAIGEEADATNNWISPGAFKRFVGNKDTLDELEFYSAGADMGIAVLVKSSS